MEWELIHKVVSFAIRHVPFYRRLPKPRTIEDLAAFPIVEKSTIVREPNAFVAEGSDKDLLRANTGGSSGTPMSFFLQKHRSRPKEKAHFDWYWGMFGWQPGSRMLMLRGAPLQKNRLFERQAITNRLAVSCYELTPRNVHLVVDEIRSFQPEFIHAYPSALRIFLQCLGDKAQLCSDLRLKAIFLGSEALSRVDREVFEVSFQTQVVNWYGHSECVLHGGNCPYCNEYHFYSFYGYLELLDEKGSPITEPGKAGRIVGTGFDNFAMPFIRYDTGDIGILSELAECECGFVGTTLKRIEGRGQDIIFLSDGTRVTLTAFIFGQHLPEFSRIQEMQLVQETWGRLILRIVRGEGYKNSDTVNIVNSLQQSVSEKIVIECEFPDRIEKTRRGKHRFLIQRCQEVASECTNSPKN